MTGADSAQPPELPPWYLLLALPVAGALIVIAARKLLPATAATVHSRASAGA